MKHTAYFAKLSNYISIFCLISLSTGASIPRAVPSTFELRPNEVVKATSNPYGASGRGRTGSTSSTSFVELQLNLCNSGLATACYADGKSIPEGGELIYKTGPNVVTINEICADDVAKLQLYLGEAWPTHYTYSVFMPAIDKPSNGPYKCKNQKPFGSVVMGRVAASSGIDAYGGRYTSQFSGNEQRTFACAAAKGDHFACTTHLASGDGAEPTALAQCKALMFDAVPYLKAQSSSTAKTVVGGDFNLEYDTDDPENAQKCVPSGWTRKGDSDVQHVIFTNDLKFDSSKKYGLKNTDHDGWLVKMTF